jgi:hypothetical protein
MIVTGGTTGETIDVHHARETIGIAMTVGIDAVMMMIVEVEVIVVEAETTGNREMTVDGGNIRSAQLLQTADHPRLREQSPCLNAGEKLLAGMLLRLDMSNTQPCKQNKPVK